MQPRFFNTIEGGALVFSDSNLNVPFDENKDFGLHGSIDVEACCINAKMNEFSAAMGVCNLKHVDDSIALRKQICQRYLSNLQKVPGLSFPLPREGTQSNYAYFPMLVQEDDYGMNRDELCDLLASHQIFPRKYFYPLTSDFPCYHGQFDSSLTPIALATTSRVITLPIYPSLPLASVDRICRIIRNQK